MAFRTAVACKIVGLDPYKLNEAITRGTYPSPPPTTKGSARLFDESELLRLYWYAWMVDRGYRQQEAGHLSAWLARYCAADPTAEMLTLFRSRNGYCGDTSAESAEKSLGEPILCRTDFYISAARRDLVNRISQVEAEIDALVSE